jgi:hypothetical protein
VLFQFGESTGTQIFGESTGTQIFPQLLRKKGAAFFSAFVNHVNFLGADVFVASFMFALTTTTFVSDLAKSSGFLDE